MKNCLMKNIMRPLCTRFFLTEQPFLKTVNFFNEKQKVLFLFFNFHIYNKVAYKNFIHFRTN